MNTASLELSRKLYELSGWFDTDFVVDPTSRATSITTAITNTEDAPWLPAYDLGYLVRKIQSNGVMVRAHAGSQWVVMVNPDYIVYADTPEDAVAMLCIKLFEMGVLKENQ